MTIDTFNQGADEKPCRFCGSPAHGSGGHGKLEQAYRSLEEIRIQDRLPTELSIAKAKLSLLRAPYGVDIERDEPVVVRRWDLKYGRQILGIFFETIESPETDEEAAPTLADVGTAP